MKNESSKTVKEILEMTPKEFHQWFEEQERLSEEDEPFEDKALKQFVRDVDVSNRHGVIMSTLELILLFIFFCAICFISVVSATECLINPYGDSLIAILSAIGFIIIAKIAIRKQ